MKSMEPPYIGGSFLSLDPEWDPHQQVQEGDTHQQWEVGDPHHRVEEMDLGHHH